MRRNKILEDAKNITMGDRNSHYGPPDQDFKRIAALINVLYAHKLKAGFSFDAHDIALIQIMVKMSRLQWNPGKVDSWVDIAGYAGCGGECATNEVTYAQKEIADNPGREYSPWEGLIDKYTYGDDEENTE